jgi:hypothetical protein
VEAVRKRWWPIIGEGGGVTSFIDLDDAATATVLYGGTGADATRAQRRRNTGLQPSPR